MIRTAVTYVIEGNISEEEFEAIKNHCINPVDSREAAAEKPKTLVTVFEEPADVKVFDGFKDMPEAELKELYDSLGPVRLLLPSNPSEEVHPACYSHTESYFRLDG